MTSPTELNSDLIPLHSFLCQCGCGELPTDELILLVNKLAADSGLKVTVVSGKRCEAHNKTVGGAKYSQHVLGKACDVAYSEPLRAFLVANMEKYGYCMEDPDVTKRGLWLHIDMMQRGTWRVFKP